MGQCLLRWSRNKPPIAERLDSYFGSTGLGGLIGGGEGGLGPTAGLAPGGTLGGLGPTDSSITSSIVDNVISLSAIQNKA